jgi:hypothetical protein
MHSGILILVEQATRNATRHNVNLFGQKNSDDFESKVAGQ